VLHAVIHNKKARKGGNAWILEDNITSSFFGPLQFLNVDESWLILKEIFDISLNGSPDLIQFEFWPRIVTKEPDMMIYLSKNGDKVKTILLEVKWQSGQSAKNSNGESPKHQLEEQYAAYKRHYEKKHPNYEWDEEIKRLEIIYLVLYGDKAEQEVMNFPGLGSLPLKVNVKTWNQVVTKLQEMEISNRVGFSLWRDVSISYLSRLLGNVFHGFSLLDLELPELTMEPLFFSTFQGFSVPSILPSSTNFFSGGNYE